ncbi:MAG TPA: DUF423 domain-containing protein [Phototrophicaceae bacterium]|nr:DUF423 domain-containing protein [Phototrophicaceae bacterium]
MQRTFVAIASILAFLGVALGAFGAHGLAAVLAANGRADTFDTANQYHLLHALALLGTAEALTRWPGRLTHWAGYLFILGIVLFSGSLYLLAIFDLRFMGAIAPFGGVALLGGWACLGLAAWRNQP